MSSRNERLTEAEKDVAKVIHQSLMFVKQHYDKYSIQEIKSYFNEKINSKKELMYRIF